MASAGSVCTSLQADNDASTPPLSFLQAGCPSCRPTNSVKALKAYDTHTLTHPFNGPFSGTTQVSWYQKGKTNLDFTETRDSEWQWHQLGHMQVCTSLQTDNHANIPPLSFLQAGRPSCHPTNSVKELEEPRKWLLKQKVAMVYQWHYLLHASCPARPV